MGFALSTLSALYRPLRRVAVWVRSHASRPVAGACTEALRDGVPGATALRPLHVQRLPALARPLPVGQSARLAPAGELARCAAASPPTRPLRVILNRHEGNACRLVISGRMADVCAELERLALP